MWGLLITPNVFRPKYLLDSHARSSCESDLAPRALNRGADMSSRMEMLRLGQPKSQSTEATSYLHEIVLVHESALAVHTVSRAVGR